MIEDDIDGGQASETVEFGLDGDTYVIDLNDENAKKLRAAFQPFVAKARRTSARRRQANMVRDFDPNEVRRWAQASERYRAFWARADGDDSGGAGPGAANQS